MINFTVSKIWEIKILYVHSHMSSTFWALRFPQQ